MLDHPVEELFDLGKERPRGLFGIVGTASDGGQGPQAAGRNVRRALLQSRRGIELHRFLPPYYRYVDRRPRISTGLESFSNIRAAPSWNTARVEEEC